MRDDPLNPYAPPRSGDELPPEERTDGLVLADRGLRFASALIDGLLFLVVLMPAMIAGWPAIMANAQRGQPVSPWWWLELGTASVLTGVGWLALLGIQAYLVATGGQSIGKRATGIKIVMMNGSPAGFVHGVLLRHWMLMALAYIPVVSQLNSFFVLVDTLFIFGAARRCVHDLIAGTKVVGVR
jgi:uncharacterized RDD family membrane protein YckC